MSLTPEQRHYLDEGNRWRRRYYGGGPHPPRDQALVDALAWYSAYWRNRAEQADAARLARRQRDMYEVVD